MANARAAAPTSRFARHFGEVQRTVQGLQFPRKIDHGHHLQRVWHCCYAACRLHRDRDRARCTGRPGAKQSHRVGGGGSGWCGAGVPLQAVGSATVYVHDRASTRRPTPFLVFYFARDYILHGTTRT